MSNLLSELTVGEYAFAIIQKQFRRIVKQEKGVLADQDPEFVHQMRVGSRRLRTALQVFEAVVQLPKAADQSRIRKLARSLGELRDLDVQMEAIRTHYLERLHPLEQGVLQETLASLAKQRLRVFTDVERTLSGPAYEALKISYEGWLKEPQYTTLAQLPLELVLPELLSPLLAELLLHPGWLVALEDLSEANSEVLHDLRKTCKHVRYQAEFFPEFYDASFQRWIDELKELQDNLGKVQDTHVLLNLVEQRIPVRSDMPDFYRATQADQEAALSGWEKLRQQYLSPDFRHQLHQLILHPRRNGQDSHASETEAAFEPAPKKSARSPTGSRRSTRKKTPSASKDES